MILMAIIAGLSDKDISCNSVKMTQKLCFLMVAEPGFGPGSVWGTGQPGALRSHRNSFPLNITDLPSLV